MLKVSCYSPKVMKNKFYFILFWDTKIRTLTDCLFYLYSIIFFDGRSWTNNDLKCILYKSTRHYQLLYIFTLSEWGFSMSALLTFRAGQFLFWRVVQHGTVLHYRLASSLVHSIYTFAASNISTTKITAGNQQVSLKAKPPLSWTEALKWWNLLRICLIPTVLQRTAIK